MSRIQGMSIAMGMESAEISRSMSQVKRDMRGLNSEAKVTSNNFKYGKRDTDSYKKAIDQLSGTTEKQRNNVEELGKRYAQTVEEQGASSKAAQDLAIEYNKQADNLNRLENELGGMEKELAKLTEEQRIAESQWTKTGEAMERNGARFEKVGGGMQKVGGIFTVMSAAVVGGIAGLTGGLFALTNKATETADAIAKGSERMGISTDFYQEMDFWASQNGLSQDNLEKAVGRLNQRMGLALDGNEKYASALETLGVDLDGVRDGTISTEDAMATSIQTLSEMENESEKAAMASELFGTKLGRELMPALNDGSLSIEEAKEKAEELGLVMSQDQLEAAEAFQDAQDQIKRAMGAVATQIGLDLMPHFQSMLDWILDNMPSIRQTIMDAFDGAVEKVKEVMEWWDKLSDSMKIIIPVVAGLALAFGPVLLVAGKMVSAIGGIMTALAPVMKSIAQAGGLLKWLAPLFKPITVAFGLLTGPIGLTVAAIAALGTGMVIAYKKSETFRNFINGIGEIFKSAWDSVKEFKDNVITAFQGIFAFFKGDIDGGIDLLRSLGLSDATIETIWEIVAKIRRKFEEMKVNIQRNLSLVGDFFRDQFNNIKSWWDSTGRGIFDSLVETFSRVKDDVSDALSGVKDFFIGIFEDIQSWWSSDGELIFDAIGTVFEGLQKRGEDAWSFLASAVEIGIDTITGAIEFFAPIVEGIFNTLWPTIVYLTQTAWSKIELGIGIAMDLIMGIISGVSALIEGDWSRFGEVLKDTALSIWDRVVEFFGGMKQNSLDLMNELTGGAIDRFIEMRDGVIEWVQDLIESAYFWWERLKRDTELTIRLMVHNVKQFFLDLWQNVTDRVTSIKDDVVNRFTQLRDGTVEIVTNLYNRIRDWFLSIYNNVRDRTRSARNTAVNWFESMRDRVIEVAKYIWEKISGWFSSIYTAIHDKMRDAKNKAVGFAEDLYTGAKEQFDYLVTGARDMMDGIGDWIDEKRSAIIGKAKSLGTGIANAAIDGFNGLIKGINWVADKLGVSKGNQITPISRLGGTGGGLRGVAAYSRGTDNHPGGPAIVGDKGPGNSSGGGSSTREIVELPNKRRYLVDGNVLFPEFPRGAKVRSNKETEKEMDMMHAFNPGGVTGGSGVMDGINSWAGRQVGRLMGNTRNTYTSARDATARGLGDVAAKGVGLADDILQYAENPMKLFTDILGKYVDFNLTKFPLDFAWGGVNSLKDSAVDKFKEWFEDFGSGGDGSHILGKRILQTFGRYTGGISFNGGKHYGIDTAHKFDPLLSPVNGKVSRIWNDHGGGNSLQITTDKYIWWFMHLSNIMKSVGDTVRAGMRLGTTGNSGNFVVGSGHLHTQVHPREKGAGNRNAINPLPVLRNLKSHATGGLTTGGGLFNLHDDEFVIPMNHPSEAMKLIALAGKKLAGKSKQTNQLPNPGGYGDSRMEEYFMRFIDNQQRQIEKYEQMINVLMGIEDKTDMTDERIGSANDRYNKRHADSRARKTGRPRYSV